MTQRNDSTSERGSRASLVVAVAPWVALTAVVVAQLVRAWGRGPMVSDWALAALRARDVGTANTPLVGAWSRYGWSHPGPALFFALAIPVRVLGTFAGSVFTALAVNVVALVALARLCWQRGHLSFGVAGLALVGLVNVQPFTAVDPWNASIVVLPLAAFLVAALGVIERRPRSGVTFLVAGAWCAQGHLGCVPMVAICAATAGWIRRDDLRSFVRRHRFVVGGVAAMWVVPLLAPGNVADMVAYVVHPPAATQVGFSGALQMVGEFGGLLLPWAGWHRPQQLRGALHARWLLGAWVVPVGLAVLAWMRRRPAEILLATCWAVQVAAVAGIRGPFYEWLMWPTAALAAISAWWVVTVLLRRVPPVPHSPRIAAVAMVVASATFAVGVVATGVGARIWWRQGLSWSVAEWAAGEIGATGDGDIAVSAPVTNNLVASQALPGVVDMLATRGREVATDPAFDFQYGDGRNWRCGARYDAFVFFDVDALGTRPDGLDGWTLAAARDALDTEQRAAVDEVRPRVEQLLVDRGVPERIAWLSTSFGWFVGEGMDLTDGQRADILELYHLYEHGTRFELWHRAGWSPDCSG